MKVAIAMHDTENAWSQTVIAGLQKTYAFYGVELLAVTNGEFNARKQMIDLKNLIDLRPDVIVTLSLDTEKTVNIFREVRRYGIKLIFFDSVPRGFVAGEDYLSFVVGDSRQLGTLSAQSLVKLLKGNGKIALLNWENIMFTVDHPFLLGIAAGILTVLDQGQIKVPNYVVIHADVVTKDNIEKKWKEVYRKPFPLE